MRKKQKDTRAEQREPPKKRWRRVLLACLLCLLLLVVACGSLGSTTASVSVTIPLSEEVQEFLGDEEYTNIEESGGDQKTGRGAMGERGPGVGGDQSSSGGGGSAQGAGEATGLGRGDGGGAEEVPGSGGGGGEGERSSSGGGGFAAGEGGAAGAGDMSSSGGGTQTAGDAERGDGGLGIGLGEGTGEGGDQGGGGGQGPDRRGGGGGGGDGSGASGSGGGGGGGDGGSETSSSGGDNDGGAEGHELIVQLRAANGRILYPRYRFAAGNGELILDERRFTPGLYTLILTKRYLKSGREETEDQEFAWGVLALNTDQDRYRPGQTAHIAIGVLDDLGAIVCDADLTLTITNPNGVVTTVSTDDGGIRVTGTCGIKEAGFITPDFETFLTMNTEGTYHLELLASNLLGNSHKLTSDVQVVSSPPFIIHRAAATRLWPFAPSPMTIEVEFLEDFAGEITDTVPDGFGITDSSPHAETSLVPATHELTLTWSGSWVAGETALFQYEYDAPDISPEFYLVGPLALQHVMVSGAEPGRAGTTSSLDSARDDVVYELRQWQIANDNEGQSTNYRIPSDVQAAGGGELAISNNYKLSDTIGETVIGLARSALYALQSGYRHTDDSYIALGCGDSVDLGTLAGGEGQLTGNIDCTVNADGAGYSLSWHGGAPSYGLVGYWKLDETSGTLAYDLSGNGNNGTHYGTPTISTTVPSTHFSTRSISFDGIDDELQLNQAITLSGDATIAAWIYKRSGFTILAAGSNYSEGYWFYPTGGNVYVNWGGSHTDHGSSSVFPDDEWFHLVLIREGSQSRMYKNGALQSSGVASTADGTLRGFGRLYYNNGSYGELAGILDEVRIFNRALSTGEILQLASTGPSASMVSADLYTIPPMEFPSTGGLLGHWKFDEIAGSVAADSSGNGNDGSHQNTPTISTSVPSNANIANVRNLDFDDASSERVDLPNNSDYDFSGQDFTVAAWVNLDTYYDANTICKGSIIVANDDWGWNLQINQSGTGAFGYYYSSSSSDSLTGNTKIELDTWYHVAGVFSATDSKLYLYVNGTEDGQKSISNTNIYYTAGDTPHIGARTGCGGQDNYTDGIIDDVRVYNRALSAAEIKALAAIPQTWSIPTTSAYWGGRLSSTSTDIDAKWGTDSSTDKWLAVGDGDYTVVSRTSRTSVAGSTETFQFRAEVGSDKIQAPGTYLGTVTVTAAAL